MVKKYATLKLVFGKSMASRCAAAMFGKSGLATIFFAQEPRTPNFSWMIEWQPTSAPMALMTWKILSFTWSVPYITFEPIENKTAGNHRQIFRPPNLLKMHFNRMKTFFQKIISYFLIFTNLQITNVLKILLLQSYSTANLLKFGDEKFHIQNRHFRRHFAGHWDSDITNGQVNVKKRRIWAFRADDFPSIL